jgi:hypothetical protein
MEFTVPQFIEKKPKIVGPLTFKQFVFIGTAAGICLFLYFTVPLHVFIIAAIFLLGMAFALAFLKIGKVSFPVFLKNLFFFLLGPKIYLWKKKSVPPKIVEKETTIRKEGRRAEAEEKPIPKVAGRSRLKELFSHLETKSK